MKYFILLFTLTLLLGCQPLVDEDINKDHYTCNTDSDCVQEQCCHATSCINENHQQDCSLRACTMDCKPETLDCGQGSCLCQNNKCTASIG